MVFLIHINDLKSAQPTFKFIDDVTFDHPGSSDMQASIDTIVKWSADNHMNINISKTKEMFINPDKSSQSACPPLVIGNRCIERVPVFKLLGVSLSTDLRWSYHTKDICVKANKRLHFLRMLKRSAMTADDLLKYYKTVIRPVIEYASPVCQSSLTSDEYRQLEQIQRRAVQIISSFIAPFMTWNW